jgi:hypothetical protein
MYFDQAVLISSAMMRRSTLSMGFVNSHITAKDTARAAAKVANSKKRNMRRHLMSEQAKDLQTRTAGLATFYYKGFPLCFLVHRIQLHECTLRDSFVR